MTVSAVVCDGEGRVIYLVVVGPNELTCTGCGEVAVNNRCVNCAKDEDGFGVDDAPALVPTVSYLRPHEYVMRYREAGPPVRA